MYRINVERINLDRVKPKVMNKQLFANINAIVKSIIKWSARFDFRINGAETIGIVAQANINKDVLLLQAVNF